MGEGGGELGAQFEAVHAGEIVVDDEGGRFGAGLEFLEGGLGVEEAGDVEVGDQPFAEESVCSGVVFDNDDGERQGRAGSAHVSRYLMRNFSGYSSGLNEIDDVFFENGEIERFEDECVEAELMSVLGQFETHLAADADEFALRVGGLKVLEEIDAVHSGEAVVDDEDIDFGQVGKGFEGQLGSAESVKRVA